MDWILKLDGDGHVAGALQEHKRLVMSLLDDEYLERILLAGAVRHPGQAIAEGCVQRPDMVH